MSPWTEQVHGFHLIRKYPWLLKCRRLLYYSIIYVTEVVTETTDDFLKVPDLGPVMVGA